MTKPIVLSLYDFTGVTMRPWAEAGYDCLCFDIQHSDEPRKETVGAGSITYVKLDLWDRDNVLSLARHTAQGVTFMAAFPVCTDLAVSGAAWFASKRELDPQFQRRAANHAIWCGELGELLGCPYMIENPVSVLATLWRKPDHTFQPFEYGGYIPAAEAQHPTWPDYIMPFDAYPKKTCLWTGGGFQMPAKATVKVSEGYSIQHRKLGGKSMKTKNIRSATPRGFARAVFLANHTQAASSIAAE